MTIARFVIAFSALFSGCLAAYADYCPTRDVYGELCVSMIKNEREPMNDGRDTNFVMTFKKNSACRGNFVVSVHTNEGVELSNGFGEENGAQTSLNCTTTMGCSGLRREFHILCTESSDGSAPHNSESQPSQTAPARRFSKDQCSVQRCMDEDFGVDNGKLKDAAKGFCDQQYLSCLRDGQQMPDPDEALQLARKSLPNEPDTTSYASEPPPPPTPQYVGRQYGPMVDCFIDTIFLDRGGPMCLAQQHISTRDNPCRDIDIVNGREAHVCDSDERGITLFNNRKNNYYGGAF